MRGSTRKIAVRALKRVTRISLPEVKRVTPTLVAVPPLASGVFVGRVLNQVIRGSTVSTRIGSKIHVKMIQVAFSLFTSSVAAATGQVRTNSFVTVMVVKWRDSITAASIPNPMTILTQPAEPEISFFVDKQNVAHAQDYKVLFKRMYTVIPRYTSQASVPTPDVYLIPGDAPVTGKQKHFFNFKVPQNETVTFQNETDAIIAKNGIGIFWINSSNGGTQLVNVGDFIHKIFYTDS